MKFNTPPQWPDAPEGWIPDPGWKPDPNWPQPPVDWTFWTNDYGVEVEGPRGLHGASLSRVRWSRRAAVGGGALLALLLGVGIGASGQEEATRQALLARPVPTSTVTVTPAPAPTVTIMSPAETLPAETVTMPVETVTMPVETVTMPAQTVTVEVEAPADTRLGIMGGTDTGSRGGSTDVGSSGSSSVYYANCSAARAAGAAPVLRGQPGYRSALDRDGDGVGCE